MFLRKKNERGQAVLIVLLSLSVVLIIILYILSRSITDISLSSKDEDSLRAFSAAEAGVERALVIGASIPSTAINDATFNANVSSFARGTSSVVFPIALKSGENATFWFIGHNADGTLGCTQEACFTGSQARFCWGDDNTTDNPAIEVTVYYKVGNEYRVSRKMFDPSGGRTQNNSTPTTNCTVNGERFEYGGVYSFSGLTNLQFATAKILYNTTTAHKIAIDVSGSGSTLPSQGAKVNSNGSFGDSNRAIEVYQLHPEIPSIFTNVIYSGSGVTK